MRIIRLLKSGLLPAILLLLGRAGLAQPGKGTLFFEADAPARATVAASPLAAALFHAQALTLDVSALRGALATTTVDTLGKTAPLVLTLPLPNGTTGQFTLREAAVMAPALAARFPAIKTYTGRGLDDPAASVRLDLTPQGFHAQVLTSAGQSFYIDPVSPTDARHYLSYYQRDMNRTAAGAPLICEFRPTAADLLVPPTQRAGPPQADGRALASGALLRTYRLALACTPEYALTKGNTVASVLAALVTTVNRVVGVYEKELTVRLELVANNDQLIFLSGTGPQPVPAYINNSGSTMLRQNQTNVDRIIGSANYDLGHVVSTGGGGVAYLGVVCNTFLKAGGVTGSPNPVGDAFDIDYVAHEMGHQFGGSHPFNANTSNCGGGNRTAATAWEPGSGSTIMAYAGICGAASDLQAHSDPTFHTGTYEQMRTFIDGTSCGMSISTDTTVPVVTGPASGKTLPIGTPFALTATATAGRNDPLTYSWEELDLGPAGTPTTAQVAGQNVPLFRSFNPTPEATRYFPQLGSLAANSSLIGERLPTVTRTLQFRCTARATHSGPAGVLGAVSFSPLVSLSVSSTAGPFVVTAPVAAVTWTGGAAQLITWDVANTTAAPVGCALVNVRLSLDGGQTYPTILALNQPNTGAAVIIVPSLTTAQAQARVLVAAADNYFFAISNGNFTIIPPAPGPTVSGFLPPGGQPGTEVTVLGSNFTGTTAVTFNGQPAAVFRVSSATQLIAIVPVGAATGTITVKAASGSGTSDRSFVVGTPPTITRFTPGAGPVGTNVIVTGTGLSGASRVTFNGTNAQVVTINSDTQLTATVPAGAGTGPIAITTPVNTGISTARFLVIPPPVITSFTPALGPPGTVVTLTGTAFTTATLVRFNGTSALSFAVGTDTQLTVIVPLGATTGLITVTTPGGTSSSGSLYILPPSNDNCLNALALTCGQAVTGTTAGASATAPRPPGCTESVDAGGVYYTLLGTGTKITVSTCYAGTTFDSKLFVYSGACGALTCVGGNDDDPTCSVNSVASTVTFKSALGTIYQVFVSGYDTATGSFTLRADCAPPADLTISGGTLTNPMAVPAGIYNLLVLTGTGRLTGSTVVNTAVTILSGGTLLTNCQPLTGAGSFTLAAGGTLSICDPLGLAPNGQGAVQTTGPQYFSTDASYVYNGTQAQATGANLPAQTRNLTTVNPLELTLTAPVAVAQVLTVGAAGNLVLNGQSLTLQATSAGTALVVNSGGGRVLGSTATVQRYLDPGVNAGRGYRHYSAPVSGATVASLATPGFAPEISQGSGFNSSASPGTTAPFPTVFGYDQRRLATVSNNYQAFDQGFFVPSDLNTALTVGQGYVVNLDAAQRVAFTGQLTSGNQTLTLARNSATSAGAADAGWQLLGNPYPAPLDFSLITAADRPNLDAAMYVFESSSPYGGTYRTYINGLGASSLIGSGQGFFVRVSSGQTSGALTFRNGQRLTSYDPAVPPRRATADNRPLVTMALRGPTGPADVLYLYAAAGATPDFDPQLDARKMPNSTGLNLASRAGTGEALAIDARPAFTAGTGLPLSVGVPAAGTYQLSALTINNMPAGLEVWLLDAATGQRTRLNQVADYAFSVSAAQARAGLSERFSLSFGPQTALASSPAPGADADADAVTVFPNPAHEGFTVLMPAGAGATRLRAELLNSLGQIVRRLTTALPASGARLPVDTAGLAVGVYTLRLYAGPTTLTKRVVLW